MATSKLHVSPEFFKQLSLNLQQLTVTITTLETFASRALERGDRLGDRRLQLILEQIEAFVLKTKHLHGDLVGFLESHVVTD